MISNPTYYAASENHCKLTAAPLAAILSPVALIGGAGLVSRNEAAQPQPCGFFVSIAQLPIMAGWVEHSQEWPVASPVDQLCSVCHQMIGLIWRRVYNLFSGEAIMNNHTKNPLVALFNVYHARKLVASNVPGTRAFRLKQRNSALIVKFDRMGGAA